MSDEVYQGTGGWWHRAPDGNPKSVGPFVTEELARAAYEKAKPKKPQATLESSEEVVGRICAILCLPVPDMDFLESLVIQIKAGEPVRVVQTFIAQEKE